MTKEEKQLLLQDLCARLPYGVICRFSEPRFGEIIEPLKIGGLRNLIEEKWDVKPYLRPMSSMTEEEEEELIKNFWGSHTAKDTFEELSWYLSKHLDINGLIPKGLAIEASEGMYD